MKYKRQSICTVLETLSILKDGHTILGLRPLTANSGDEHLWLVLVQRDTSYVDRWVTWIYNAASSETVSGNYHRTLEEGFYDFQQR